MTKQKQHQKLFDLYRDKLGTDTIGADGRLDLLALGIAAPQFGAAHTLDTVAHLGEPQPEDTIVMLGAIEQQTIAFMTDEATAAAELLYGQVMVLNAAFNKFMQLATLTIRTNPDRFETFFDAAMKAQEQARKTLQTLHDIKNPKPRTVFIKNAIAQQVNQLVTKTEELQKKIEAQNGSPIDIEPVQSSRQKKNSKIKLNAID